MNLEEDRIGQGGKLVTYGLTIRDCEEKDESQYVKLNLEFMKSIIKEKQYWSDLEIPRKEEMGKTFREALKMPEYIKIIIAEIDKKIVGYANTWTVYSIWSKGKALTIDDLYVDKDYRRNGIGKEMMNYLIKYAKKNHYKRIQLHAEIENEKAHKLYKSLEFNEEEILFFMKNLNLK